MNRRKPPLTNRASYKEAQGNKSIREVSCTGRVIYSVRTVVSGAGSPVPTAPAALAAHVPSTLNRTVHTLPLRRTVGGHDGMAGAVLETADTCGA